MLEPHEVALVWRNPTNGVVLPHGTMRRFRNEAKRLGQKHREALAIQTQRQIDALNPA